MANFKDSPHFSIHNDYYTPKHAWADIKDIIIDNFGTIKNCGNPTIYEAFLLNSNEQSKKYLQELGFNTVGDKTIDFLNNDLPKDTYDIVVSNPPFERIKSYAKRKQNLKYRCIEKLLTNEKPFIILLNSTNIFSRWFKDLTAGRSQDITFIFPSKKINYNKYKEGGEEEMVSSNNCSFNSIYVCYKMGYNKSNLWI
jgi:hypothetical protein